MCFNHSFACTKVCASYHRILSDSHVICSECDGFWGGLSNKSGHPLKAHTQQTEGAGRILHRMRKRTLLPHSLLFKPSSLLILLLPHSLLFKTSSLLILLLPHCLIFKPSSLLIFLLFSFSLLLESKRAVRRRKKEFALH